MNLFEAIDLASFPTSFSKNNILSAIIQIEFTTKLPIEVIIGSLYSSKTIIEKYKEPQPTGANQIPQHIRAIDPNLKRATLFNFDSRDNKFRIGCGSNTISLANLNFTYDKWEVFKKEFETIIAVINVFLVNKERIGVRYINTFDEINILNELNMNLNVRGTNILDNVNILFEEKICSRTSKIKISNNVSYSFFDIQAKQNKTIAKASILDIDVVCIDKSKINAEFTDELELSHNVVKKIFFGMLKTDFLSQLGGK